MAKRVHIDINTGSASWLKQTDAALNLSESLYRSLFENAPIGIVITDNENCYLDANSSACKMLGYTHEELVGLHASKIVTQVVMEYFVPALECNKARKDNSRELLLQRKDGSQFPAEVMSTMMPDGKLTGIFRDISERHKAQMISNRLAAIVESSDDAIIGKDLNGIVTSWNVGAERIFGYKAEEMLGTSITRLIPPELLAEENQILAKLRRGEKLDHFETHRQTKDKVLIEVSVTTSPIKDAIGNIVGASKIVRDITTLKDRERQIVRNAQLYAALSQCNQAILHCSDEAELLPIICRDAVQFGGMEMAWIGMNEGANQFIKPVASFGQCVEFLDEVKFSVNSNGESICGPEGMALRQNEPIWCQDFQLDPVSSAWHERAAQFGFKASASLPLSCGNRTVGVFSLYSHDANAFDMAAQNLLLEMSMDISFALNRFYNEAERKKEQNQLFYLANFDALTGLPNRNQLADHFKYAISLAKRNNEHLAVIFIDIDRFKNINDSLGHSLGDAFLIAVASRIQLVLRAEDAASRLGGDEFILTLPGCDRSGAEQVVQKLVKALSEPYKIAQHNLQVTASIGIALYPEDGTDLETLSKNADTAMYRAKQEGRDGYRFFTAEMQAHVTRNVQIINGMRQALAQDLFRLHFQPQVSIQDEHVIGFEALLRWQHPELGYISPAEFIPVAEDCGLILQIGEWVLRKAVLQLKRWMDRGHRNLVMAVNLSAVQFRHPSLPDMVSSILKEMKMPPKLLELELTESVMMHDPHGAIAIMDNLYDRGVRMSLDDFGTGYSSLNYLKKFKVYKLKIDQSFVRDIGTDPEDMAIVSAIISMSKNLGLQTIAEGVETIDQLDFLFRNGCNEAQGFHFSKPIPARKMEEYFASHA